MPYMPANKRPCDGGTGSLGGKYGPFSPIYTYLFNLLRKIMQNHQRKRVKGEESCFLYNINVHIIIY